MKAAKERRKMRIIKISAGAFAALVVAFWLFILYTELGYLGPGESISYLFFVTLAPLAVMLAMLFFIVRRRERSMRSRMPLRDERSDLIEGRAGKYAMMGTLWFLLAVAFYQMFMEEMGLPDIPLRYFIWIVFFWVIGLFAGLKLYFSSEVHG